MAIIQVDHDPSPRDLAWFAAILLAVSAGLGVWLVTAGHPTAGRWAWFVGGVLLGVFAAVPRWRRGIYLGWIYAFYPLGFALSYVVLALVFFGVVTPIGLLLRLRGRDAMNRGDAADRVSFWKPRAEATAPERYFRPY